MFEKRGLFYGQENEEKNYKESNEEKIEAQTKCGIYETAYAFGFFG